VARAVKCLRGCLNILRLCQSHLASTDEHDTCDGANCNYKYFREAALGVHQFFNDFSSVIFSRTRQHGKQQWWLSSFYGLWIMSFSHRALLFIRSQMNYNLSRHHSFVDPLIWPGCAPQLRLALQLFKAASSGKDPLAQEWSLENPPLDSEVDLRLLKFYRMGRRAIMLWSTGKFRASGSFGLLESFLWGEERSTGSLTGPMRSKRGSEASPDSNVGVTEMFLPLAPVRTAPWEIAQIDELSQLSECLVSEYSTHQSKAANNRKRPAGSPPGGPSLSPLPSLLPSLPYSEWDGSTKVFTREASQQDSVRIRTRGRRDSIYSSRSHYSRDSSRLSRTSTESLVGPLGRTGSSASGSAISPLALQPSTLHGHGAAPRSGSNDSLSSLRRNVRNWSILGHSSSSTSLPVPPMPSPQSRERPSRRRFSFSLGDEDSPVPDFYRCECCPKKPKKFDTQEELMYVHNLELLCILRAPPLTFNSFLIELTKQRSSTAARSVGTDSGARTKQIDTRIVSMSDPTAGAAAL